MKLLRRRRRRGNVRAVSTNEVAKAAALEWMAARGWPEDMSGFVVQLVEFGSVEDTRYFYPGANSGFMLVRTRAIEKRARTRKAKVHKFRLTPEHFGDWLTDRPGRQDTPQARIDFAESMQCILTCPD